MHKPAHEYFHTYLEFLQAHELYPDIRTVTDASSVPRVMINGEKYLNFCSNNYLGLARNEEIERVMIAGVEKYGIGSGSTRLLSGTLDIQAALERGLAEFFGYEDAITFSSGFLANVGVIRMLVDPFPYFSVVPEREGVILTDELNHASVIDGVRLSHAERVVYKHNDMEDLERLLEARRNTRKLVITDGVFSMDGELANLGTIADLATKHDALLMVDDSHGVGVLGPNGMGTAAHLNVNDRVDVLMGSFTKAFGSIGGFITTTKAISDYLRVTARSYIFSDPIVPSIASSLMKTIEIVRDSAERRTAVLDRAAQLRSGLRDAGFTVLGELTPIVPLLIGSEEKAIRLARTLYEQHIFAPCIRPPAVTPGKERIRFSVMATHVKEDIDELLNACRKIGAQEGLV